MPLICWNSRVERKNTSAKCVSLLNGGTFVKRSRQNGTQSRLGNGCFLKCDHVLHVELQNMHGFGVKCCHFFVFSYFRDHIFIELQANKQMAEVTKMPSVDQLKTISLTNFVKIEPPWLVAAIRIRPQNALCRCGSRQRYYMDYIVCRMVVVSVLSSSL